MLTIFVPCFIIISYDFGKILPILSNFVSFFYEVGMQANFNIDRERNNRLFYKEYKNDKCIFQFHSQIELYFVDEGEMEFVVNNHRRTLQSGEMSVALSYDSHAYRTPVYSRSSVFIIPIYMCESFIQATKNKKATYPFILDKDIVKKIKEYINELRLEDINEIKKIGYIHLILGIIIDNIFFENSESVIDTALSSRLLFYINESFNQDLSLDILSAELGLHKTYISKYFKECFNVGFNQYLTSIRLKNALILMNDGKHSITDCAMESGFNSMRTFYRVFSKEFGCTPKQYIEKMAHSMNVTNENR